MKLNKFIALGITAVSTVAVVSAVVYQGNLLNRLYKAEATDKSFSFDGTIGDDWVATYAPVGKVTPPDNYSSAIVCSNSTDNDSVCVR